MKNFALLIIISVFFLHLHVRKQIRLLIGLSFLPHLYGLPTAFLQTGWMQADPVEFLKYLKVMQNSMPMALVILGLYRHMEIQ